MLPLNIDIKAVCEDFARQQGTKTKMRGDEMIFLRCPYCGTAYKGDKEKFAINIRTGAFNCMRAKCGAKGNLWTLHKDFGLDLGSDVTEYEIPRYAWKRFKVDKPIEPTEPAIEYLHGKRGISEDVIRRYRLRIGRPFAFIRPLGVGGVPRRDDGLQPRAAPADGTSARLYVQRE